MSGNKNIFRRMIFCALLAAALLPLAGCEDDDDYDHKPPAGMGTLVLENDTVDDISVAIDGVIQP
ncbi:MAG TPA: hypothetical protein PKK36_07880, partial [Kiritimatiellia bacterium]|nr:hypothetical protein [Kiritimatiellia bacterium]